MEIKNHVEALSLAIKTEEEGYNVFTQAAEKTRNVFLKDLFSQLASDEKKHMAVIKKYYNRIAETSQWDAVDTAELKKMSSKTRLDTIYSDSLNQIKKGSFDLDEDDLASCKWALKFEDEGAKMYNELYMKSEDKNAKLFYSLLRDMENEHYDTLNNLFTYLDAPESFHKTQDGWTMED